MGPRKKKVPAKDSSKLEAIPSSSLPVADVSSNIYQNATEKALNNAIIVEEIFSKLPTKNQKEFRLVKRFWRKETLSVWERTAWLRVINNAEEGHSPGAVQMKHFFKKSEAKKLNAMKCTKNLMNYNLEEHPYHRCRILGDIFLPDCERALFENAFWKAYGVNITHLWLSNGMICNNRADQDLLQRLISGHCPNLKYLQVDSSCYEDLDMKGSKKGTSASSNQNGKPKPSEYMETLIVMAPFEKVGLRNPFKLCPNLKTLSVRSEKDLSGLVEKTISGEHIKLQSLKILQKTEEFTLTQGAATLEPLANYLKIVPETIQHLELTGINLWRARRNEIHLFTTVLPYCSSTLKTLSLEFAQNEGPMVGLEGLCVWLKELSAHHFPNLTKLKLNTRKMYFDFDTLKKMPKLKELEVSLSCNLWTNRTRRHGLADWFLPANDFKFCRMSVPQSNIPFRYICKSLVKFSFSGWWLNSSDVEIFSGFFPNLVYIKASFYPEALTKASERWKKLETVYIHWDSQTPLKSLRELKKKNDKLRIIQDMLESGKLEVVKRQDGKICFEEWLED